jgi:hypothetical protein
MPVSAGSTPAEGTIAGEARQDEHPPCKREAAGSSPATGSANFCCQRSTDGPCAALVRRRLSVRIRPLALGRRTGVQCCLANSACSVRYRGCPLRPDGQIGKGTWPRTRFSRGSTPRPGTYVSGLWLSLVRALGPDPRGRAFESRQPDARRGGRSGQSRPAFTRDTLRVRGPSAPRRYTPV